MLFKTTPHLGAKAQYMYIDILNLVYELILVGLGDFGQTPGPSSVLEGAVILVGLRFWTNTRPQLGIILEGAGAAAAFLCHYYSLRT